MKILIIGCGFVGKNLLNRLISLNSNYKINVVDINDYCIDNENITFYKESFSNSKFLDSILPNTDIIFHLSGSSLPRKTNNNYVNDIENDLINTVRLLDKMVEHNVNKIVFLSSGGTIYGNNTDNFVSENSLTNPISNYGLIKLTIEKYLNLYKYNFGLEPLILRVSNLYGPQYGRTGLHGIITTTLNKTKNNEQIEIWGDGNNIRDYLFIDDLTDLLISSINSFKEGIFNIGSGKGVSINELIKITEEITKLTPSIIYKEKIIDDVLRVVLNIEKIKSVYNWQPKIDINKGIKICWDNLNG